MKTWGLALSGGGACGLANIGVLEVLHEAGLKPDYISGSSMGAIVGGLYAIGEKPDALRSLAENLQLTKIAELETQKMFSGLHTGFFRPKLKELLHSIIGNARIGDCGIPFVCIAGKVREPIQWQRILNEDFVTTIKEQIEPVVFDKDTLLIDAIMASSAVPVVFSPVKIEGEEFIDLVHFGAIPARTLRQMYAPNVLVATDTTPQYENITPWLPNSWQNFLKEGYQELQKSKDACDLIISCECIASPLSFDKTKDWIASGKKAAAAQLENMRTLLS